MTIRKLTALLLAGLLAVPAVAQSDPAVTDAQKAEVVRTLGEKLRSSYVFPEVAATTSQELERRADAGTYADHDGSRAFAEALRADLREVGNDRHFQVRYDPSFKERPVSDGPQAPGAEEIAEMKRQLGVQAYGVYRTARLPGNVGYIDVRFFGPTEFVAPAYESAMQLLAGMSAIIVDLRSNGGGDPDSVVQLVSHFFAQGDERHVNSIYDRLADTTRDFWLVRSTKTRFTGPVYVLTSDYTFSGGEEFAYDLQTQKRATLIGETTGGGANPGGAFSLGHGFYAFIPTGRAINPITKTNWEHVGVKPDHEVSAEDAFATAYKMAVSRIADEEPDAPTQAEYRALAERDPATIPEAPRWKHPRE